MVAMIITIPHTYINTCPPPFPTTLMQSPLLSNHNDSPIESEDPSSPIMHPLATGFQITPEDTDILNKYLDGFERANTQTRNTILEKLMGELYRLRSGDSTFDKKEAKKACIWTVLVYICTLMETYARKSESGSTITTLLHIVGHLTSFGNGLQGMSSSMIKGWRSWSLQRKCPEVLLEVGNSWDHFRMHPPTFGMSCLLKNRSTMQRWQGTGPRMYLRSTSNPGK